MAFIYVDPLILFPLSAFPPKSTFHPWYPLPLIIGKKVNNNNDSLARSYKWNYYFMLKRKKEHLQLYGLAYNYMVWFFWWKPYPSAEEWHGWHSKKKFLHTWVSFKSLWVISLRDQLTAKGRFKSYLCKGWTGQATRAPKLSAVWVWIRIRDFGLEYWIPLFIWVPFKLSKMTNS